MQKKAGGIPPAFLMSSLFFYSGFDRKIALLQKQDKKDLSLKIRSFVFVVAGRGLEPPTSGL